MMYVSTMHAQNSTGPQHKILLFSWFCLFKSDLFTLSLSGGGEGGGDGWRIFDRLLGYCPVCRDRTNLTNFVLIPHPLYLTAARFWIWIYTLQGPLDFPFFHRSWESAMQTKLVLKRNGLYSLSFYYRPF